MKDEFGPIHQEKAHSILCKQLLLYPNLIKNVGFSRLNHHHDDSLGITIQLPRLGESFRNTISRAVFRQVFLFNINVAGCMVIVELSSIRQKPNKKTCYTNGSLD